MFRVKQSGYKKLGIPFILVVLIFSSVIVGQRIPRFRLKEEAARDYFRKGLYFYNSQKYVAAREFFYKALDKYPSFHLARRYLGDSNYYSGEWNAALDQWEFLDSLSGGAYPLIRQRSELLRFYFSRNRRPGRYVHLHEISPSTWKDYQFSHPVDIALDSENNLYLLSFKSANVIRISPGGEPMSSFRGPFYNTMKGPLALTIYDDKIYICDYSDDTIRIFTTHGRQTGSFGKSGNGDGEFRGPSGIIVTDRAIFVSDAGNMRIQKFDKNGKFLLSFNSPDSSGRPEMPAGLAMDARGILYLADRAGRKILTYDQDGNFIEDIRTPFLQKPRGLSIRNNKLIVADEKSGIFFYDLSTKQWNPLTQIRDSHDRPIIFNRAFSAKINKNGVLYIAEYGRHKMHTIAPRGLRFSNLDVKIQRIDRRSYPDMTIFLTVKNRLGYSIPGLTRSELKVFSNNHPIGGIRTDNIKVFNQRINIAIVKENSKYFRDKYDPFLGNVVQNLLTPLRIVDQIQVIRIGKQVRLVYNGLQRLRILQTLKEGDLTTEPNLGKGLYEAITRLLPGLGPRHVVMYTSGLYFPEAFNQYSVSRIIQYARSNEINLHVVSFEGDRDTDKKARAIKILKRISNETGGKYYRGFDTTSLKSIYKELRENLDRRYIITYKGEANKNLKGRYVDVRVEVHYLGTFGKGDGGYFVP